MSIPKASDSELLLVTNFYVTESCRYPGPPMLVMSHMMQVARQIYQMGLEAGYRQRDGEKIIDQMEKDEKE